MVVYIDLMYLVNVFIGMCCLLSLSIFTRFLIPIKKLFWLSLLWGFQILGLYLPDIFYYLWIIVICFLFSQKNYLKNSCFFLLIHLTFLNSFYDIKHYHHVLLLEENMQWLLPTILGGLIIFLYVMMLFQFQENIKQQSFQEEIILKIHKQEYSCTGFMDTGNQSLYQGIPMIYTKINLDSKPTIHFHYQQQSLNGYIGQVYFNSQWHDCIICIKKDLTIPQDCLLNFYLL